MAGGLGGHCKMWPRGQAAGHTPSAASCPREALRLLLPGRLRWVGLPAPQLHLPPLAPLTLPSMTLVPLQVLSVTQQQRVTDRATAGKCCVELGYKEGEGLTYNEAALWRRGDREKAKS